MYDVVINRRFVFIVFIIVVIEVMVRGEGMIFEFIFFRVLKFFVFFILYFEYEI